MRTYTRKAHYQKNGSEYMKIKIPNTNMSITVKKGNRKPIPPFVWLISMTSGEDCPSRMKGLCPIHEHCYVLAYEENPFMREQTLRCRAEDEEAIDYMVDNHMAEWFANELVRRNKLSRTHPMRFLRWNESGDMKSLDHFLFIDEIADILHEKIGAISVVYTKRKDLWEKFKDIRKSKWLIVNGSGFMADNNFKAVDEFSKGKCHCPSNCEQCFKYDFYFCYDIEHTGQDIEEILRRRNGKDG